MRELKLEKNERIVEEIDPAPEFKIYLFLSSLLALFMTLGIVTLIFTILSLLVRNPLLFLTSLAFYPLIFLISSILANRIYKHKRYWITNKRIIERCGLSGNSFNSMPLKSVSELLESQNFLEKMLGISTIHVLTVGSRFPVTYAGARISIQGLRDAEKVRKKIWSLVKKSHG